VKPLVLASLAVFLGLTLQDVSLTSKYDNAHHCLPEPLLGLPSLRQLLVRFPSLTGIQDAVSRLTSLEVLRVEGLQGTLIIEPGVRACAACQSSISCCRNSSLGSFCMWCLDSVLLSCELLYIGLCHVLPEDLHHT
jgi:hypothetical protein